ncbi:hypothetical protein F9802_10140 [Bacillus aerolatus]|uniref:Uncharacterized protein n=1 Tax=Bacillus aerolatus TaxID=2653354 RepID=A0A6I1FQ95_9BACI|nr:hypothetical protein [Bacillus aerolatus]KAB7706550.1 hypothetical protein F9802_10140 [Bacillus aerolatus]
MNENQGNRMNRFKIRRKRHRGFCIAWGVLSFMSTLTVVPPITSLLLKVLFYLFSFLAKLSLKMCNGIQVITDLIGSYLNYIKLWRSSWLILN